MENEVKEPAVSYSRRKYTIEEYLEMEMHSDIKHEYFQGEIFARELQEYKSKEEALPIRSVGLSIPLTDIYEDTGLIAAP